MIVGQTTKNCYGLKRDEISGHQSSDQLTNVQSCPKLVIMGCSQEDKTMKIKAEFITLLCRIQM